MKRMSLQVRPRSRLADHAQSPRRSAGETAGSAQEAVHPATARGHQSNRRLTGYGTGQAPPRRVVPTHLPANEFA